MSYSKSYLAKMRGKKVRFIIVNSGADLKVSQTACSVVK